MILREFSQHIVLQPPSHFDSEVGSLMEQQLATIVPERHNLWILDMAGVTFIDSSGLCSLVRALKLARKQNCRLVVCQVPDQVRVIFEITQLDQALDIVSTLDDALAQTVALAIA